MEVQSRICVGAFTACVMVDDKELPLYGIEVEGDKATCWLPSEAGKEFKVLWKDSKGKYSLDATVSVDGLVCGTNTSKSKSKTRWHSRDYRRESNTTIRKLSFANIQTTDDDEYLGQSIPDTFGSIELDIWKVKYLGTTAASRPTALSELRTLDKIHERSKKAMGHQVRLGEPIRTSLKGSSPLAEKVKRLATFVFRYRPEAFLQANGFMPRENNQTDGKASVIDLTLDSDDPDEEEAFVDREIQNLEERLLKLKQKKQKKPYERIKKEIKPEPRLA